MGNEAVGWEGWMQREGQGNEICGEPGASVQTGLGAGVVSLIARMLEADCRGKVSICVVFLSTKSYRLLSDVLGDPGFNHRS